MAGVGGLQVVDAAAKWAVVVALQTLWLGNRVTEDLQPSSWVRATLQSQLIGLTVLSQLLRLKIIVLRISIELQSHWGPLTSR